MKKALAAQLDSSNLDRAGIIEQAATIISELMAMLTQAEDRANAAETRAANLYEGLEAANQAVANCRVEMEASQKALPGFLGDICESAMADQRKATSRAGGKGKHAKHEQIKQEIKKNYWIPWQAKPNMYTGKSAFDKAMLDKYDGEIADIQTISKWRREFQKNCL